MELRGEFDQSRALYELAAPLNAAGIQSLVEEADKELHGGDRVAATSILVGRLAELDFDTALELALKQNDQTAASWVRSIFHGRARLDIDDAIARAAKLPVGLRARAGASIIRSRSDLSNAERTDIGAQLGVNEQQLAMIAPNASAALARANSLPNSTNRTQAQFMALMRMSQEDPLKALAASEELENSQSRTGLQAQILSQLAVKDHEAALAWIESQPAGKNTDKLSAGIVAQLARVKPEVAQQVIQRLPESMRYEAERSFWQARATADPEGAALWVSNSPTNLQRSTTDMTMLMLIGMQSPDSAERFFDALSDEAQVRLEPTYVQQLAQQNPEQAARRVEDIADDDRRLQSSHNLVSAWAESDTEAALRWVGKQPTDQSVELFRSLGSTWGQQDVQASIDYTKRMRAGPARDSLASGVISSGQLVPKQVDELVDLIEDATTREQAVQRGEAMQQLRSHIGSR